MALLSVADGDASQQEHAYSKWSPRARGRTERERKKDPLKSTLQRPLLGPCLKEPQLLPVLLPWGRASPYELLLGDT